MARNYKIATEFSVVDRATAQLNKMSSAGSLVGSAWSKGISQAQARLDMFGKAAAKATKWAVGGAVAAVSAGIGVAAKRYLDFDDAITAAGAKFKDLDVTSADHKQHLLALQEAALDVAGATRFTATDTAGALDKMAMAGLTASQSMAMLRGTASLASATGKDLTSAVDMVTDSLSAFNMTKDEFGKPLDDAALAASLQHMSDVVAKTTNMANTDMDMWFESVKMGAPTFSALGGKIEDFSAMVGVLANAGIKGGEAGTAIRNMMLRLSDPKDKAEGFMKGLGVSVYDAAGNMLPILDILKQFETAFAGDSMMMVKEYNKALKKAKGDTSKVNINDYIVDMDMSRKIQSLNAIFGQRVVGDFLVLLGEGSEGIAGFSQTLQNSAGAAANMADAMDKSLKGRIETLKSALETLGIRFVKAFEEDGATMVGKLTAAVGRFTKDVLPKMVTTIRDVLPTVINVISGVVQTVWKLRGVIVAVVGSIVIWRTVTTAAVIAMNAYKVATSIITGAQLAYGIVVKGSAAAQSAFTFASNGAKIATIAFSGVMKVATAAQWLFNAALNANPIGLVIAAVVALTGVILVLTGKWEAVTAAVDGFFERIRNMEGLGGYILGVLVSPLETLWNMVRGLFDVMNAFKAGGFLAGIKMMGLAILQSLVAPVESLLKLISFIPGMGKLNDKLHGWFDSQRANILAGGAVQDNAVAKGVAGAGNASALVLPEAEGMDIANTPPTQTAAMANSYSREESVTTNRVELSVADNIEARYGALAPAVSIQRGGR